MRKLAVLMGMAAALTTCAPLLARDPTPKEKCEIVERERQKAEHDHATGKAGAERVKEAKEQADKVCRDADRSKK